MSKVEDVLKFFVDNKFGLSLKDDEIREVCQKSIDLIRDMDFGIDLKKVNLKEAAICIIKIFSQIGANQAVDEYLIKTSLFNILIVLREMENCEKRHLEDK